MEAQVIHHIHTIELSTSAMIGLVLILAVIVFCAVYSAHMPSLPPDPPREPIGFIQR